MPDVQFWNDKIIFNNDGWGYRISEGDVGEAIIYYFEDTPTGRVETEKLRLYLGETTDMLLRALLEKLGEMHEADSSN